MPEHLLQVDIHYEYRNYPEGSYYECELTFHSDKFPSDLPLSAPRPESKQVKQQYEGEYSYDVLSPIKEDIEAYMENPERFIHERLKHSPDKIQALRELEHEIEETRQRVDSNKKWIASLEKEVESLEQQKTKLLAEIADPGPQSQI